MGKSVYIYEKRGEALDFLSDFFTAQKGYVASFFTDIRVLRKKLGQDKPDALITCGPSCIDKLKPRQPDYPIITILSQNDMAKGWKSLKESNVEDYILPPFHVPDLEYKLTLVSRKMERLQAICQEKEDLEAIAELTRLLSSTLDPQEVLYTIVKKLGEIIPVARCSILSVGSRTGKTAKVIASFEDPKIQKLTLELSKYPEIRKALRTKEAVVITDALKDPLMKDVLAEIKPIGIKSIVVMPILFRSEVIGTLFLRTSRKSHVFTAREVKLCRDVASVSANALNNAFMFHRMQAEREKLEKLAITDFLTGIYNIRYLYHRLDDEFSRAVRYRSPLSCIMLDIDHFKRINDTYGHKTGDVVLREFATLVKNRTRKSDIFARYGGEEFILILPHSDSEGAFTEGKRLKDIIREHQFKALTCGTRITVSMGIASCPHKKVKIQDDLISLADDALMRAKMSGRDHITISR